MKFRILLPLGIFFSLTAYGSEPLKFKAWKEQQIVEAQNEMMRIRAKVHSKKSQANGLHKKTSGDELSSARFDQAPDVSEQDVKIAQEGLAAAKALTLEDYADVYVNGLRQDPEQFSKLLDSLSKEELSQIMKTLVKNKAGDDNDSASHKLTAPPTLAIGTPSS